MCIRGDSLWHDGRFSAAPVSSLLLGLASNPTMWFGVKSSPFRHFLPPLQPGRAAHRSGDPGWDWRGLRKKGRLLLYVFFTFLRCEPHRAGLALSCPYRYWHLGTVKPSAPSGVSAAGFRSSEL